MTKNDIAQLLSAASDSMRQQLKPTFVKNINIAIHNTFLKEEQERVFDYFSEHLEDRIEIVLKEFNNWVHNTMRIVYRRTSPHIPTGHRQLYRKAYFSSSLGDVFLCCSELLVVVLGAYNITATKHDTNGVIEITVPEEQSRDAFIFA